ncbi:putative uncharacterized protein ENSP00000383309 [Penaeus vannamei]|uniref:putative uncharacterized protein ENSP00000383309 n=1 Tax=Penaeus vannamei TaxID=6689 RepID=UPI00387F7D72
MPSMLQPRPASILTPSYSIQHTTYSIQHTTYSIQHTTYNIQHTNRGGMLLPELPHPGGPAKRPREKDTSSEARVLKRRARRYCGDLHVLPPPHLSPQDSASATRSPYRQCGLLKSEARVLERRTRRYCGDLHVLSAFLSPQDSASAIRSPYRQCGLSPLTVPVPPVHPTDSVASRLCRVKPGSPVHPQEKDTSVLWRVPARPAPPSDPPHLSPQDSASANRSPYRQYGLLKSEARVTRSPSREGHVGTVESACTSCPPYRPPTSRLRTVPVPPVHPTDSATSGLLTVPVKPGSSREGHVGTVDSASATRSPYRPRHLSPQDSASATRSPYRPRHLSPQDSASAYRSPYRQCGLLKSETRVALVVRWSATPRQEDCRRR